MKWYWSKGWWCPRHPWPPAWARLWPYYWSYQMDPSEELKALEELKKDLEANLKEISKRIEELRKIVQEKK